MICNADKDAAALWGWCCWDITERRHPCRHHRAWGHPCPRLPAQPILIFSASTSILTSCILHSAIWRICSWRRRPCPGNKACRLQFPTRIFASSISDSGGLSYDWGVDSINMDSFEEAYQGAPPWEIGRPQPEVVRLAENGAFRGAVLDVGCGSGGKHDVSRRSWHRSPGCGCCPNCHSKSARENSHQECPGAF